MKSSATPSAVISSVQGMKRDALEQSWSVMVRIESYPWDLGSLVMKSRAMTSNGFAFGSGNIGANGALVGRVLTL